MASRRYTSLSLTACAAVFALLACLSPATAPAQSTTCISGIASICINNQGGTGYYNNTTGFHMDGSNGSIVSTLTQIGSIQGSNLGSLSLSLGTFTAYTSNGFNGAGTFAGGSMIITNTTPYSGFTGTLFQGSVSNVSWNFQGKLSNGTYGYVLNGTINGTWGIGGGTVSGVTTQLYFESKTKWNGVGAIQLGSGTTDVIVPEPASMSLMGTGLFGVAILVRKKIKR